MRRCTAGTWARLTATALLLALVVIAPTSISNAQPRPPERVRGTETIATGLTSPWGLAFLPDGTALVSERDTGLIKRIRPGAATVVRTVGQVPGATPYGEGGLLGIAVPPGPKPRWVYAYFTSATDNRIVRMPWDGRRLGAPRLVLAGIPRAQFHNGGRLVFGPDGMLYASTGDTTNGTLSQDVGSLGGKVLRMTPSGGRPKDNPFPRSLVWTLGHRNVQGLAFDPAGRLFATEFGQKTVDELNLLRPGRNYGWPMHEGAAGAAGFVDPIAQWTPTSTASPSGVAIAGSAAYVATLAGQRLFRVPLSGRLAGTPVAMNLGDLGRIRTVSTAPDGSLWLMTSNTDGRGQVRAGDDRIVRLTLR
ncbi:MAG: PQQ-dependent sugar dehydrogenase [Actinomycetes bacterium]